MTDAMSQGTGSPPPAGSTRAGGDTTPTAPRRGVAILIPVVIFAALAGLFLVALRKGDPSKIPSALIGKPAPAVTLAPVPGLTQAGKPMPGFSTSDLAASGKPVVVNFWASWCLPCVEEHPQLTALARQAGVAVFGVNQKDDPANATRFLARHGNPYTAVGADPNGRAAIEWGVYGTPETFVVDGKGIIVYKHVGPIGEEALRQQILPALKKAAGG